jgi:hypothetical protein
MSNTNLTTQREQFEAMMETPIADAMIRQEGAFLFARDINGNEWSVKVSPTGKIKKNSLRREF